MRTEYSRLCHYLRSLKKKIMLLQAERIAKNLTDPRMKPLLKVILADERRNHKTLVTLKKTIMVEEKVSEDDC